MNSRRVESVVISWRKINYHIVQLVPLALYCLQQSFNSSVSTLDLVDPAGAVLIPVVPDHTDHKLIQTVRAPLHTVDRAVGVVDSASR